MPLSERVRVRLAFLASGWAALLLGASIYLAARTPSLIVFRAAEWTGLGGAVAAFRDALGPWLAGWPPFCLYSLPDGLWTYALMAQLDWAWRRRPGGEALAWLAVAPLLGLGGELAQYGGLVAGTPDPADLAAVVACSLAGFFMHRAASGTK